MESNLHVTRPGLPLSNVTISVVYDSRALGRAAINAEHKTRIIRLLQLRAIRWRRLFECSCKDAVGSIQAGTCFINTHGKSKHRQRELDTAATLVQN